MTPPGSNGQLDAVDEAIITVLQEDGRRPYGEIGQAVGLVAWPRGSQRHDAVEYVVLVAGSFDLLCEIVCADETALLDVINDGIRAVDGVRETETFMHLRTDKNVFSWAQRLSG